MRRRFARRRILCVSGAAAGRACARERRVIDKRRRPAMIGRELA